jgi:DNA polymerase III subunit alpha
VPPIGELLRDFPPRRLASEHGETLQGLGVRLVLQRERAVGEVDLGEDARFFPTDRALASWRVATHGEASVVYAADHA